jgi:hypothetical protein
MGQSNRSSAKKRPVLLLAVLVVAVLSLVACQPYEEGAAGWTKPFFSAKQHARADRSGIALPQRGDTPALLSVA